MAIDKKSFTAYCDWINIFNELTDDEAGKLIKHILKYVNDLNPTAPDRVTQLTFTPIKTTLKRDLKKWESKREQNKANALKRWNKKNANACERIKSDANDAVSVSVSDSVSVIYNKFVDEVKNGGFDSRIESLCMRLGIKKTDLNKLLENFKLHTIEDQVEHKSTNEYFKHFKNYLNKQDRLKKLDKFKKHVKGQL